jgi:hypothetical protein
MKLLRLLTGAQGQGYDSPEIESAWQDEINRRERDIDSAATFYFEERTLGVETFYVEVLEFTQVLAQILERDSDSRFHGAQRQIQMLGNFAMG